MTVGLTEEDLLYEEQRLSLLLFVFQPVSSVCISTAGGGSQKWIAVIPCVIPSLSLTPTGKRIHAGADKSSKEAQQPGGAAAEMERHELDEKEMTQIKVIQNKMCLI